VVYSHPVQRLAAFLSGKKKAKMSTQLPTDLKQGLPLSRILVVDVFLPSEEYFLVDDVLVVEEIEQSQH